MEIIPYIIDELEEVSKPLFETRNFEGYFQSLNVYETKRGEKYRWCFYVAWFTNDGLNVKLLKWDRSYVALPIDPITI